MEIIWRDWEMGNGFLNGCRSVPFKNVECKSVQDERIQENEQIGFFGNPFTAARERIFVNEFVQRNWGSGRRWKMGSGRGSRAE